MIINIKFGVNNFISFFLSHSSESWCIPPTRDIPDAKSYICNRGSNMAKMIEGDLRNPKMHNFIISIILGFCPKYLKKLPTQMFGIPLNMFCTMYVYMCVALWTKPTNILEKNNI